MGGADSLELTLLCGARRLLSLHARELPQRDDLCGAFCASLALRAAGVGDEDADPLDQDAVALAAGSTVSRIPDPSILPPGERGRRDYRIDPPLIEDSRLSGTTPAGVLAAVQALAGEQLAAIPYSGPWTTATLDGLFAGAAALQRPVTLLANVATRYLWGAGAGAAQLLGYLLDGAQDGPPPDWDVGHFVCLIGRLRGARSSLYLLADTYPSLGRGGLHMQPRERLAAALERREMAPGGVIAIVSREDAAGLRARAEELGLDERLWDNGSLTAESLR